MTGPVTRVLGWTLLLVSGCSARAAPIDAGFDAPPEDARFDIGYEFDGSADALLFADASVRPSLCGPALATGCPVQSAGSVSGCPSGEGAVFFDGVQCRESPAIDCGADPGAFRSFEECAVVCEGAGHCDASKIFFTPTEEMPGCAVPLATLPVVCPGGISILTSVPLEASCETLGDYSDCRGDPPFSCMSPASGPLDLSWEEAFTLFRRASLLPFVMRIGCSLN